MPLTLLSFPPSLAWTWITSLDIINASILIYHFPYAFCVEVHVLRIPLVWLTIDPFDIATWHVFLLFHS
jgi:hypothetical protein